MRGIRSAAMPLPLRSERRGAHCVAAAHLDAHERSDLGRLDLAHGDGLFLALGVENHLAAVVQRMGGRANPHPSLEHADVPQLSRGRGRQRRAAYYRRRMDGGTFRCSSGTLLLCAIKTSNTSADPGASWSSDGTHQRLGREAA